MERKCGDPDVRHDGQKDSPSQFCLRGAQSNRHKERTHKNGNLEQQGQVQGPQADKEQSRENHVPAPAQPAGRDAVAHDAADVDAVGGGNEAVLLVQGLNDHLILERFVQVCRGGKVPGDIGRGFLADGVGFVPHSP